MLLRHRGQEPTVDPSAFVAPTATLVGDVRVGPRARVMYGAVLDAEGSRVEVGECAIVCEHAVLRSTAAGDEEHPTLVDDHAFISPHATLLGCHVQAAAYVATAATVLQGAEVGSGSAVAVGAFVHAGTSLPEGFFLPPGSIAAGEPARVYAPGDPELAEAIRRLGFARRAFGVGEGWDDRAARYRAATEVRSEEFAPHADDEIIE
jgi:carbonic anhydrase/acetyltransferase-like protein (isoleucine patch superfamily)